MQANKSALLLEPLSVALHSQVPSTTTKQFIASYHSATLSAPKLCFLCSAQNRRSTLCVTVTNMKWKISKSGTKILLSFRLESGKFWKLSFTFDDDNGNDDGDDDGDDGGDDDGDDNNDDDNDDNEYGDDVNNNNADINDDNCKYDDDNIDNVGKVAAKWKDNDDKDSFNDNVKKCLTYDVLMTLSWGWVTSSIKIRFY